MPNAERTPRQTFRVDPDLWAKYALACEARGTNRAEDLRNHIARRVKDWEREQARRGAGNTPSE